MSRVGKRPIPIPSNAKVAVDKNTVAVEGPKGKLSFCFHPRMHVEVKDGAVRVSRPSDTKLDISLHGTTRAVINNMLLGVTEGFTKELEIQGVGFRAQVQGKTLNISLGFSHPVNFPIPEGIVVETPKPTQIIVKGIDKAKVGETAAKIRSFYPPEPYKGKGIRYVGEYVRRKAGKAVG